MSYQIRKVGNGYMVTPGYSPSRDAICLDTDIYVFRTWQQASAWINAKFKESK